VQKLVRAHQENHLGPSDDPNNYMGPVISQSAMKTILDYIEVGKKEGKLLTGGKRAAGDRLFHWSPRLSPTWIPRRALAQEEVFGPVLAVIKAKITTTPWKSPTTPSSDSPAPSISKNPEKIKKAEEAFHVGNLYLKPQNAPARWSARIPLALQHVRHGFQDRRKRLFATFPASQIRSRKSFK